MFAQFQNMIKKIPIKVGKATDPSDTSKIPQTYQIGNRTIQQKILLSQGAFGFIWKAEDINKKQQFALKRVICMNKQRLQSAMIEKQVMSKLPQNPHLVAYYGSDIKKESNKTTVVTLMQLCPGGTLFDLLEKKQNTGFTENQLIVIALSICKGLDAIHKAGYYHRDIKIENVLVGKDGKFKLCDFGSSSNQNINFKQVPKIQYNDYLQEINSFTTPMYRSPQMVDPYLQYEVSYKADIWMLGCLMFTLCYFVHPFLDSNAVGIANAVYKFPDSSQTKYKVSEKIKDFIRLLLTPDPSQRPTIPELVNILGKWDSFAQIPLNKMAKQLKQKQQQAQRQMNKFNKKVVDIDGDIPIEKLMQLQNKLKNKAQTQTISTTFIKDNETKKISQQSSYGNKAKPMLSFNEFNSNQPQKSQNIKKQTSDINDLWGQAAFTQHKQPLKYQKQNNNFSQFTDLFSNNTQPKTSTPQVNNNPNFMQFFSQPQQKQQKSKAPKKVDNLLDL